ncbi:MAG TPA: hypothetical protein VNL16_12030 [Chloroflexota bacterium]|nr:hypothetical protein [Chloroflexota bacterium]
MADLLHAMPEGHAADPDSGNGCGCSPSARPADSVLPPQPEAVPQSPNDPASEMTVVSPRRSLKLVVTLQPAGDHGYRAIVALGSADCDPLFLSLDAPDVPAVLAGVPSLLADAEARWNTQPRYPSARPIPKAGPPARAVRPLAPPATAPQAEAAPTQPAPAPVTPTAPKSASGQLSLFG